MAITAYPPGPNAPALVATDGLEEEAACTSLAEAEGAEGRAVIGQVLRPFLDARGLIPLELFYSLRALKRLIDSGSLLESTLVRVATAQARASGGDPRRVRSILGGLVAEALARAQRLDKALNDLPPAATALKAWRTARTLAGNGGAGPNQTVLDEWEMLRAALCRDLGAASSWAEKLDVLIKLIASGCDTQMIMAIDQALADLISTPAAAHILLGEPIGLGATLERLLDLVGNREQEGQSEPPSPLTEQAAVLRPLFRANLLPATEAAAFARTRRLLRSPEPLNRRSSADESARFRALLTTLVSPEGVSGGVGMAESLTLRHARSFIKAGSSGVSRALPDLARLLEHPLRALHFLAAFSATATGKRYLTSIGDWSKAVLTNDRMVETLVFGADEGTTLRRSMAGAARAIEASGLSKTIRQDLILRLAGLVDSFARSGELVRRLESKEPSIPVQAARLSGWIAREVVRDEEAINQLRWRLRELVARSEFKQALDHTRELGGDEWLCLREAVKQARLATGTNPNLVPSAPVEVLPAVADSVPVGVSADESTILVEYTDYRPVRAESPQGEYPTQAEPFNGTIALDLSQIVPGSANGPPNSLADSEVEAGGYQVRCPNCFVEKRISGLCAECGYDPAKERLGPHLAPGSWLQGRYQVGRLLGRGGFGATYLGWDARLEVKVAIKEYFPVNLVARISGSSGLVPYTDEHGRSFATGIRRFLEEARILARLRGVREIVDVQDYFEGNNTTYLVMELLQGQTLKELLRDRGGRLGYVQAVSILLPIIQALQRVHEQGLIHRDISPDNVFITRTGDSKLLDFGAARQADSEELGQMTVILKMGYAPPEQYLTNGRQGPWTDVYGLCATFFCVLTGRAPLDATSRLHEDSLQPPSALGVELPPEFEAVLMSGLALRAEDRPQTLKALLAAFVTSLGDRVNLNTAILLPE
ncbi:eukaryotic-like serine/threonine-protein kinase [uncultured Gammaproteobacteria bacterium]